MIEFMYYEIIAGIVLRIDPEEMFTDSRKGTIPTARQFCMCYRRKELKMEQAEAGARYSKDHATVIHAIKTIKNRCETNKDFRNRWNLFLKKCKDERNRLQEVIIKDYRDSEFKMSLTELDRRHTNLMYHLYNFVEGLGDEDHILMCIKYYQNKLTELYRIMSKDDNQGTLG